MSNVLRPLWRKVRLSQNLQTSKRPECSAIKLLESVLVWYKGRKAITLASTIWIPASCNFRLNLAIKTNRIGYTVRLGKWGPNFPGCYRYLFSTISPSIQKIVRLLTTLSPRIAEQTKTGSPCKSYKGVGPSLERDPTAWKVVNGIRLPAGGGRESAYEGGEESSEYSSVELNTNWRESWLFSKLIICSRMVSCC